LKTQENLGICPAPGIQEPLHATAGAVTVFLLTCYAFTPIFYIYLRI